MLVVDLDQSTLSQMSSPRFVFTKISPTPSRMSIRLLYRRRVVETTVELNANGPGTARRTNNRPHDEIAVRA